MIYLLVVFYSSKACSYRNRKKSLFNRNYRFRMDCCVNSLIYDFPCYYIYAYFFGTSFLLKFSSSLYLVLNLGTVFLFTPKRSLRSYVIYILYTYIVIILSCVDINMSRHLYNSNLYYYGTDTDSDKLS